MVKVDWLKSEVLIFNRRCKRIDADARRFNFVSVRCVEQSKFVHAETAAHLAAIIIDYTAEEIMIFFRS